MTMVRVLSGSPDVQLERVRVFVDVEPPCKKCQGVFLAKLRCRLNACPALTLQEKLEVVIDIFTSFANDPLIISIHELEGLHAAARSVLARSMDRRKKLPVSVFASQALTRWVGMHKSRLGTLYRAPLPVLKHILKKARTSDKTRSKSGHNLFMKEQNDIRTASGAKGRKSYQAHLAATHKKWRGMAENQQQQYHDQAQAAPLPIRIAAPTTEDEHATTTSSP